MKQAATQAEHQLVGETLLESGAITREALDRGLAHQRNNTSLRLGETLVAMGLLAVHELVSVLHRRAADCLGVPRPVPLGSLLVAQGKITAEQLDDALALQASGDRRPLGRILLETRAIANADLLSGLTAQTTLRHATAMAMLGASLSFFQPNQARAEGPVTSSAEVQLSLNIAPRMEMKVEENLAELIGESGVIQMPTKVILPDIDGSIASVLAEPLAGDRGVLALRNAAGDSIPFAMRIVPAQGEPGSNLDTGKSTLLAFPNIGAGGQPSLAFDLSAEDLIAAQTGGYHATIVILVGPEA